MQFFNKLFKTSPKSKGKKPAERKVRFLLPGESSDSPVSVPSAATGSDTLCEVDVGAEDVEVKRSAKKQFPSFRQLSWFKKKEEKRKLAESILLAKGMAAGIHACHPNNNNINNINNINNNNNIINNNNNNRGNPNHFNWRNPVHQLKRKHKDEDYTKNTKTTKNTDDTNLFKFRKFKATVDSYCGRSCQEIRTAVHFTDIDFVNSINLGIKEHAEGDYISLDKRVLISQVTKEEFDKVISALPELLDMDLRNSLLCPVLQLLEMKFRNKIKYYIATPNLEYGIDLQVRYEMQPNREYFTQTQHCLNKEKLEKCLAFQEIDAWTQWPGVHVRGDFSFLAARKIYDFKWLINATYKDEDLPSVRFHIGNWYREDRVGKIECDAKSQARLKKSARVFRDFIISIVEPI
ncbi:hypothetical protein PVL30_002566 [Lodderomyces elongisporus]|uniref:uncharacterized protein n=1 Tax=Lodderomyces elongisporus TaxID=36914 RepID=UPI00292367A3|nr:uncharacterized protein PVL30_002564 [Lodderomyces elongisporus]XP_060975377.1 uncharacterized protein PVL30_002566 [Lodderomyces elongisporus]WLF78820.1 hypothetical protein PVL30_002564 [Lodderomyces elongisporus]WLF78822.1 hypothetical protein PVL30_002566 [Lodderomyces elongisporus]